ncbi:hypothetical protein QR680_013901 [Steinernema hermaphroditum]|uniref:G-protein coupled receptors family 1 profile domain-containing protein n=1 Tax=Steinernema hermaphroditum TaxID=289476 RepID=A0AA39I9D3_9BILA|nr:hypothetical protein QR680_013901 [Steinernema hermaphroditum]
MGNSQFIFNAYGFLILGIFLILFNLPVLIVVVCAKKLRNQYGVVIMSLVNGFLSGMTGIAYGVFRLALFGQGRENDMVSLAECMYNPLTFFLLWTFPMIGIGLFINSIDRLLVISFPLSYFNYNTRVVVVLNIVALVVNAGIVFVAVYGTLNGSQAGKMINIFCSHNDLFTVEMFILLASIRCFFATMSVLLMFVVLVLFMKQNKITTKLAFHTEESIQKFKARQMNYTKTMLLSCIATIVLFLIPALFAIVARAGFVNVSGHVSTWTRFISFFDSFNIAFLLFYRQSDIRWRLYRLVNIVTHTHLFNATKIQSTHNEQSAPAATAKGSHSSRRVSSNVAAVGCAREYSVNVV